ncbi:MAG TPA: hypothetical protein VK974_09810 [Methylophilaceae bacterium]|nr:hypothetical protein [Methylophilaceae bacterium]
MEIIEDIVPLMCKAIIIDVPVMLIDIQLRYYEGITALELYEVTRGAWRVGSRREGVRYAFAVAGNVIREVYEIDGWYRAGTTPYRIKPFESFIVDGRWEFIGSLAPAEIRSKFKGHSVAGYFNKGQQNQVAYANC